MGKGQDHTAFVDTCIHRFEKLEANGAWIVVPNNVVTEIMSQVPNPPTEAAARQKRAREALFAINVFKSIDLSRFQPLWSDVRNAKSRGENILPLLIETVCDRLNNGVDVHGNKLCELKPKPSKPDADTSTKPGADKSQPKALFTMVTTPGGEVKMHPNGTKLDLPDSALGRFNGTCHDCRHTGHKRGDSVCPGKWNEQTESYVKKKGKGRTPTAPVNATTDETPEPEVGPSPVAGLLKLLPNPPALRHAGGQYKQDYHQRR